MTSCSFSPEEVKELHVILSSIAFKEGISETTPLTNMVRKLGSLSSLTEEGFPKMTVSVEKILPENVFDWVPF